MERKPLSTEHWDALLDASADAMVLLDAGFRVMASNSAFRSLMYSIWNLDAMPGAQLEVVLDRYEGRKLLAEAFTTEEHHNYHSSIKVQDTEFYFEISSTLLPDQTRVLSLRDRTEQRQLQADLANARQGATMAQNLNDSIATQFQLTYQPTLRASTAFGWWLQQQAEHEVSLSAADLQELAAAQMANGNRLERLVGVFLAATNAATGKLWLKEGRYFWRKQLAVICHVAGASARERYGSFSANIRAQLPELLQYDFGALSLILNSLIGFGLALRPYQHYQMVVDVHEETSDDYNVRFTFLDATPLSADVLELLQTEQFLAHMNMQPVLERYHYLGLHFALRTIKLWGGKVLHHPTATGGSRWDIWLNFRKVNEKALPEKQKLLILAPNDFVLGKVSLDIEALGHEIIATQEINKVPALIAEHQFKAVLIWQDWGTASKTATNPLLAATDGTIWTEGAPKYINQWSELLAQDKLPIPAWVAVVRMPDSIWQDALTKSGFDASMALPADTEAVLLLLAMLQEGSHLLDDAIMPSQLDMTYLENLAGDDHDFKLSMVQMFLQQAPVSLSDLEENLNKNQYKDAAATIHKLKSNLKLMGLVEASASAEDLERSFLTMHKDGSRINYADAYGHFKRLMSGAMKHYHSQWVQLSATR